MSLIEDIAARYGATVAPDARITVVPRGQSGLSGYEWDGQKLIAVDPQAGRNIFKGARRRGIEKANAAALARQTARRKLVEKYHAEGMTTAQIAEMVRAGRSTVLDDLRAMRLQPHIVAAGSRQTAETAAERRRASKRRSREKARAALADRVRALAADGRVAAEIAQITGQSLLAIVGIVRRNGIELPPGDPAVSRHVALRDRLAELYAAGADRTEMRRVTGLDYQRICYHLERMGLAEATRTRRPPSRIATDVRREQVAALLREGLSQRDIALRIGVSKSVISNDARFLRTAEAA